MTIKPLVRATMFSILFATAATAAQAAAPVGEIRVIAKPPVHAPAYGGPISPVIDSNGLLPNGVMANEPTYG